MHCEVRITRRYRAAPAEVWTALTDPESIGRWLGRPAAIELSAGGPFELEVGAGRVDARVRDLEPERLLELDWRYGDEEPSVVRFELAADGDGTVLVLDHRRIEEPVGMSYMTRWGQALNRLGELVG